MRHSREENSFFGRLLIVSIVMMLLGFLIFFRAANMKISYIPASQEPSISLLSQDAVELRDPLKILDRIIMENNREWRYQDLPQIEKEMSDVIERAEKRFRDKWASDSRLDAFCDDYFGYLQGFRFIWLAAQDIFSDDSPSVEMEVREMINRHLLYDMEKDLAEVALDIEAVISKRSAEFMLRLHGDMGKAFSDEELKNIKARLRLGEISVTPSEFSSAVRTAGNLLSDKITLAFIGAVTSNFIAREGGAKGLSMLSGKVVSSMVAKVISSKVLSKVAEVVTTLGVALIIDYAISEATRAALEDDMRMDLKRAMNSLSKDVRLSFTRSVKEMMASARSFIPVAMASKP